ncbi:MAG: hypothetical protein HY335_09670 [Deinococcus sp.]|nr:hypothetical protein [Deinococcus sp.]
MMTCPSRLELSAYIDGELDQGALAAHLTACQHCQRIIVTYQALDALLAPPGSTSSGLAAAVRQRAGRQRRRVLAALAGAALIGLLAWPLASRALAAHFFQRSLAAAQTITFRATEQVEVPYLDLRPLTQEVGSLRDELALPAELALRNYRFALSGISWTAGRLAWVITARPRHARSPWYRLWLDVATGLRLASETFAADGALSERRSLLAFSQLPQPGPALQLDWLSGPALPPPVLPSYLPPGYELLETRWVRLGSSYRATVTFSDGFNLLTLFIRQAPLWQEERSSAGPVQRLVRGGFELVLIGDLDQTELSRILDSVQLTPVGTVSNTG